jgi:hypothetical protein
MSKLPNQISGKRADLLAQIARCYRLANQVADRGAAERLLALAADYEKKLTQPTIRVNREQR